MTAGRSTCDILDFAGTVLASSFSTPSAQYLWHRRGFFSTLDRKPRLLPLWRIYPGNAFCALAQTYHLLVAAALLAGHLEELPRADLPSWATLYRTSARGGNGLVMSAFSIANICGVPLGLSRFKFNGMCLFRPGGNSAWSSWRSSGALCLPSFAPGPLRRNRPRPGCRHSVGPAHQKAFSFYGLLTFTGFVVFPYLPKPVANVGLTESNCLDYIVAVCALCSA